MTTQMLIDAGHAEETRMVVLTQTQIQEFDFEADGKRSLRNNIYLAKITRVEPSLQAAFVEYGGNRHGFLAFGEIHPDYYQIPTADREAILREQVAASAEADEGEEDSTSDAAIEDLGGDGADEDMTRRQGPSRKYNIQEVIKRNQIILVQVAKEERGNKGAALTTYLSLAGRYCVLMPNSTRHGGVSRKISQNDRRKLKKMLDTLDVPETMGLIIRTAGAERSLTEIKRDYQYLMRVWAQVREQTLESTAPSLVYEEGSLIKRSIRDIYNKDFEEILIEGDNAYKEAKDYIKLLMPSHARKVKQHKPSQPIFKTHKVEDQLAALFNPTVPLPSGGYLVINLTEALVSVDVNSGKATGAHSVERTALNTNLEAAEELARQMRLRDLAGLLVIDFIDMDEKKNNHAVERRLKDALKNDRARIRVGRISPFGLLEMSRQRMRAGLLEGSGAVCTHCSGSGFVRSVESRALHILRQLDAAGEQHAGGEIILGVPRDIADYILNHKRATLVQVETAYNLTVSVRVDDTLATMEARLSTPDNATGQLLRLDGDPQAARPPKQSGRKRGGKKAKSQESVEASAESGNDEEGAPRKRRRRGRRGGRRGRGNAQNNSETAAPENAAPTSPEPAPSANAASEATILDLSEAAPQTPPPDISDESDTAPKRRGWWNR